jgi:hypothetical protein
VALRLAAVAGLAAAERTGSLTLQVPAAVAVAIMICAMAGGRRAITCALLGLAATLGGIAGVALAVHLQTRGLDWLLGIGRAFLSAAQSPACGGPDARPVSPWWTHPAMVLAVLAVPAAVAIVLGLASRVLRVPLSAGLVRGFRGAAIPVACLVLLVYGGAVLTTAHYEARLSYSLRRTQDHEGRYLAEVAGEEWPGPVR